MDDSDYETSGSVTGLSTPPLSPTKSTSTYGWMSPRTPVSPRKTQSCLFFRDADAHDLFPSPSKSPIKPTFASRLSALQRLHIDNAGLEQEPPSPTRISPLKHSPDVLEHSPSHRNKHLVRFSNRSAPDPVVRTNNNHGVVNSAIAAPQDLPEDPSRVIAERNAPCIPSPTKSLQSLRSSPSSVRQQAGDHVRTGTAAPSLSPPLEGDHPKADLDPLPLRFSSSPLRPSQWTTRGGLLTPPPSLSRSCDRFISSRRPPNISRQSFELSKPSQRLSAAERVTRGGMPSADPFSRRLHRSGRLNDELQSLRETHSVITGRTHPHRRGANATLRRSSHTLGVRHVSPGAVWGVGGASAVSDTVVGVSNGRGGVLGSGTNAPLYTSMFLSRSDPEAELETYEQRLALAFDVDQTGRVLDHGSSTPNSSNPETPVNGVTSSGNPLRHVWKDNSWTRDGPMTSLSLMFKVSASPTNSLNKCPADQSAVNGNQYRYYHSDMLRWKNFAQLLISRTVLDAPQLRDDYYCSLLAYSHSAKCLAVGLGNFVHLWSERKGVDTPESLNSLSTSSVSDVQYVTSLSFSSTQGGQAILAVGRADGRLALWSPFESEPRFNAEQPKPVSCVSFRPGVVKRPSLRDNHMSVATEELLVGDEAGHIYFYSVEWPNETDSAIFGWHGALTLLARMKMHSQQVCGLAWSADGELFASGGNDNVCYLYETKKVLQRHPLPTDDPNPVDVRFGPHGERIYTVTPGSNNILSIEPGREKHRWELNAAVKAIAFCPWQRGLLAIGGGSNDRCIHFYHTVSGACLATIDCAAQITSLIWSTTRREIAATFGFAQPDHPFRVAVFSWPSCEQIVAIPWYDENRALYAIPYPGGPSTGRERGEDGVWSTRAAEEGCIVVAASDAAIRFHEIWTEDRGSLGTRAGLLGGSGILESLHGIEKEGDQTIR